MPSGEMVNINAEFVDVEAVDVDVIEPQVYHNDRAEDRRSAVRCYFCRKRIKNVGKARQAIVEIGNGHHKNVTSCSRCYNENNSNTAGSGPNIIHVLLRGFVLLLLISFPPTLFLLLIYMLGGGLSDSASGSNKKA